MRQCEVRSRRLLRGALGQEFLNVAIAEIKQKGPATMRPWQSYQTASAHMMAVCGLVPKLAQAGEAECGTRRESVFGTVLKAPFSKRRSQRFAAEPLEKAFVSVANSRVPPTRLLRSGGALGRAPSRGRCP